MTPIHVIGERIFFISDRDGEFNLYAFDAKSKAVRQITRFTDSRHHATAGGGKIIFERGGYLYTLDPATGKDTRLKIAWPRFTRRGSASRRGRSTCATDLSPAARASRSRCAARSSRCRARKATIAISRIRWLRTIAPLVSPDGKSIAWFSDESGEYQLFIESQDGRDRRARSTSPLRFYAVRDGRGQPRSASPTTRGRFTSSTSQRRVSKISSSRLQSRRVDRRRNRGRPTRSGRVRAPLADLHGPLYLYSVDSKRPLRLTDG